MVNNRNYSIKEQLTPTSEDNKQGIGKRGIESGLKNTLPIIKKSKKKILGWIIKYAY
jgi:hypothetical protein